MAKPITKATPGTPQSPNVGMQKCNCVVRLGGSLLHTVQKTDITPAEVVLLRRIHGNDAVVEFERARGDFTTRQDDHARLIAVYGHKAVTEAYPQGDTSLPKTFSAIGIRINEETSRTKLLKAARAVQEENTDELIEDEADGEDYSPVQAEKNGEDAIFA
jgi:hypothetical protein